MSQIKTLTASLFSPTNSFTGNRRPSVFRGENLILRGASDDSLYLEAFGGNLDLGENYDLAGNAITGTLTLTSGSTTVIGAATDFLNQLHIGQMLLCTNGEILTVREVVDATRFISYRKAGITASGQAAYRLPQMFELNNKRAVMLTGNAIQFEKGHIIAAGSGELRVNGAALGGTPLIGEKRPKVALYRPATNTYEVRYLGFPTSPPAPVINPVPGGVKGMVEGNKHSFMISYWSAAPEGTDGYSDPSTVVKKDGSNAPLKLTAANNQFEIDFSTALASMPANATGFVVWGSLAGRKTVSTGGTTASPTTTTSSPNETLYENGSWYRVAKIKTTDLVAGRAKIEYLDSDIYEEVTGNNDNPPDCEFVCKIENKPMYISCFGKATVTKPGGTAPGQYCAVSKAGNPEGVPTEWAASVTNNIIGWFEGVGRWFMMTQASLEFIVATGLTGSSILGGNGLELPIASRPYWRTGAANRYSIILVDDTLYGFSGNKLFKSIGSGDENSEKYDFGAPVEDITRNWNAGQVYAVNDSKNNNVCFVFSGSHKNASGYWCSTILPYSLFRNAWLPQVVLSDESKDMIVSGVASVGERFEFLAGGRKRGGGFETRTYRYDEQPATTEPVPYYLVWQITDDGAEKGAKEIKSFTPTGKFTQMMVQVHGARPGGELIVSDMEKGLNALSGDIGFEDSEEVTFYLEKRLRIRNLGKYAIRLSGVWDGVGMKDRLDELAVEIALHGKQR